MCEVAGYNLKDAHKEIAVTHVVGEGATVDTEAGYTLKLQKSANGDEKIDFEVNATGGYTQGDGTVPMSIAADLWSSDNVLRATESHQALLDSDTVKFYITAIFNNARSEYDTEVFSGRYRAEYLDLYVEKRVFAAAPRSGNEILATQNQVNISANNEIMRRLSVTAPQMLESALTSNDEDQKADLLAIAASTGSLPPLQLAWTFNNLSALETKFGNLAEAAAYGGRTAGIAWSISDSTQREELIRSATKYQWQALTANRSAPLFGIDGKTGYDNPQNVPFAIVPFPIAPNDKKM